MALQSPEFKYVTDGCVAEWKASNASFKLSDPVPMPRFLYELCSAMVRGDLPIQKCKVALDSVVFADEQQEEMGSVLADIIAHMGQDFTMPAEHRNRLVKLVKWAVDTSLVPSRFLQERCEEEFLWECEISKIRAQDLKAKEVRVNTRLLYQQTKFNLLREESEGYAKLVTLLCQDGVESPTGGTLGATISIIKSLIGHFDLDPNRVFDIVLECFELFPDRNTYLDLIPIFPKSHAAQILGFKFQYYQRMDVNDPVPFGLYRLTASLVKAEFIDLDSIYAHLLPKDHEAFENYNAFLGKRLDEIHKIGKINLAATGKELMDDEKQDVTIDLFAALDMESEAVKERACEIESSQILGLLMGFLSLDDWCHAQVLFDRLSNLNPVEHLQISDGLLRVIEKTITATYTNLCQSHLQAVKNAIASGCDVHPGVQNAFVDLPKDLFQMLAVTGPYLYRDPVLLQKVCRVLRAYYLSAQEFIGTATSSISTASGDIKSRALRLKEAKQRLEEALGTCLLPSLQLIPANPAVGQSIWEVLSLLPYEDRYRLYGEWEKDDERMPMVLAARQISKLDTRRILKRLAKENLKQLGRMVAKLAHANPMTVLRTIVHQIEAYRDMITPVVDAFKYLTQLEYDVLEYVVIERLALGGREKLKEDGLNLSDWLQSLALFWGLLCKKYPSMDLRGLLQYIVNQLKRGMGIELVVLQELIQQMANIHYTENVTEEQLDAMAGSETLRYQATLFGMARNNKALSKSTNRLRDSLLPNDRPDLAIPLLVLIGQYRSMVVVNADVPHIKMISEQFDRCHGTLLQYVEFLSSAISPAAGYAKLIPPLHDLVHKYHLDPEVAFLVYRPVMRLFKCSEDDDEVFWPHALPGGPSIANVDNESEPSCASRDALLDVALPTNPIKWSDLLATIRSILPLKAWNSLSPDLYATFWGLTLHDIFVPRNRYEAEIDKQHAAIKALEELSDNSNMAITKRRKEKERIQEILDRLIGELQKHEQHVVSVRKRLSHEKDMWLCTCSDSSKINLEFLQRCIFPRCVFSMPDAVYCAVFVHTLHSLGTPFFNTVNHIDVLICKTLHPMICCCTEFEAGRLGRFLYETLKMAYHWKSDESIYERECGNMPGFAVYYKFPNSQRVTFGQFIRMHLKWSLKLTRLLVQCLESAEYIEIRNALVVLTKISGAFPVIRKSGVNLEKRVAKIKGDEREDLKVLATGVAAALAARKSSWVSEEEFAMGHIDIRPAATANRSLTGNLGNAPNGSISGVSPIEASGIKNPTVGSQGLDHVGTTKGQHSRAKSTDGRPDHSENGMASKSDLPQTKARATLAVNGSDSSLPSLGAPPGISKPAGVMKTADEHMKVSLEEASKVSSKATAESETRSQVKRSIHGSSGKQPKQELVKDDSKSAKSTSRTGNQLPSTTADRDFSAHPSESRQSGHGTSPSAPSNANVISSSGNVSTSNPRGTVDIHSVLKVDKGSSKASEDVASHSPLVDDGFTKQQKRTIPGEEQDRLNKRRKGDTDGKDNDVWENRLPDKERSSDFRSGDKSHPLDHERNGVEERNLNKPMDKVVDKSKEKSTERYDKEHRDKSDRADKIRSEDIVEKSRDRSMERHGRERSVERISDRGADRNLDRSGDKARDDRNKDDRGKPRHGETSIDKSHTEEHFHGQSLPPPPPLPPSFVPQSVGNNRRDEESDRRIGSTRHVQRLSPRHDEKERRRSEENASASLDDAKRRRDDDYRERKRDEREAISLKVDERDRDRGNIMNDDVDPVAVSKRRKLKRDHTSSSEAGGEYSPVTQPSQPLASGTSQLFDARERGKGTSQYRAAYFDEVHRLQGKEAAGKIPRRETDLIHEREWDEEKRPRAEVKRKHRK